MARTFVIAPPVADLRGKPLHLSQEAPIHDMLRESQLLFQERILVQREEDEWCYISALEQLRFTETTGWTPFPGWVHRSELKEVEAFPSTTHVVCAEVAEIEGHQLSYGTFLTTTQAKGRCIRQIPRYPNRASLVQDARLFVGAPYLWGGRSFPLSSSLSSVDCSGLINLLYRAQGVILPRNAHEQYLSGRPVQRLLAGDPLYLSTSKRITHVFLKLDEETYIESPRTGAHVRLLRWGEELWEKEGKIYCFDVETPFDPYPVTFFPHAHSLLQR